MSDNQEYSNLRKPPWLKIKPSFGKTYTDVKSLLKELDLHTVCQEASCPNIGECFSAGTATFIILGDKCTRNCRFCDVHPGKPSPLDCEEPSRLAEAVKKLKLRFVVVTSVTRDDLPDGGAEIFAETIKQTKIKNDNCKVEVLTPDFKGNTDSLDIVLNVKPDVFAHNLETVPELYSNARPQANYRRSLDVLRYASKNSNDIIVKSGMMVGLGENIDQIRTVLNDAADAGCKIFTVGQYLAPSKEHLSVKKFYTPDEFIEIKKLGEQSGIPVMVSGPLVRSSYMAHKYANSYLNSVKQ